MNVIRSVPRVMLLIDADNVTADVIEQALQHVLERHGAAHVRRAYCTAELAQKHLKLFKAHSIRPMVNISTGKNSTDIALAVDAMDLVLSERPDVAVLVSSDSDFAPLVIRLREKGCRVEGIGQAGKTGDDSKPVYDEFVDIAHRKGFGATLSDAGGAAVRAPAARKTPAKRAAAKRAPAGGRSASRGASAERGGSTTVDDVAERPAAAPAPAAAAAASPAAEAVPASGRGRGRGRGAAAAAAVEPSEAPAPAGKSRRATTRRAASRSEAPPAEVDAAPAPAPAAASSAPAPASTGSLPDEVERILAALPELNYGARVQLNQARERLQAAGLLARSAPSTKLFRKHPALFALTPEKAPNKVQFLRPTQS